MNIKIKFIFTFIFTLITTMHAAAETKPVAQSFKIYDMPGYVLRGTYDLTTIHIKVVASTKKQFAITSTMHLPHTNKKNKITQTVTATYSVDNPRIPLSIIYQNQTATQKITQGSIRIHKKYYKYNYKRFAHTKNLSPYNPPQEVINEIKIDPKTPLILLQTLPLLAPKILTKAGKLKDISVIMTDTPLQSVRFHVKHYLMLTRSNPQSDGSYAISLYLRYENLLTLKYDKDDQLIHSPLFFNEKMQLYPSGFKIEDQFFLVGSIYATQNTQGKFTAVKLIAKEKDNLYFKIYANTFDKKPTIKDVPHLTLGSLGNLDERGVSCLPIPAKEINIEDYSFMTRQKVTGQEQSSFNDFNIK